MDFQSANVSRRDLTGWGDKSTISAKGYDLNTVGKTIDPQIKKEYTPALRNLINTFLAGLSLGQKQVKVRRKIKADGTTEESQEQLPIEDLLMLRGLRALSS